jgi:CHAD domain-containing protein
MEVSAYIKLEDLKPVLAGYIKESKELLEKSEIPDEKVIHDVRVLMKKSRATLRLLASQLDKDSFDKNIKSLREVGRLLSSWRDMAVQRKVLKDLRKKYPKLFLSLMHYKKLTAILNKPDPSANSTDKHSIEMEKMKEILHKTGFRIRFLSMNMIDPQLLIKDLEKTYINVVDSYLISRNEPGGSSIHEFRKRTKDFLYQLYFFRPINSSGIKSLEKKLNGLTLNLGKYNDLSQLIKNIGYDHEDNTNPPALNELVIRIRERQDQYLKKIWPSAFKIFRPGQNILNLLGLKILIL